MSMDAVPSGQVTGTYFWDGVGTPVANKAVKLASDTEFTPVAAAADYIIGVIEEIPELATTPVKVVKHGPVKMIAGTGGITRGQLVMIDATGGAINATPTFGTERIIGTAEESVVAGAKGTVFLGKIA